MFKQTGNWEDEKYRKNCIGIECRLQSITKEIVGLAYYATVFLLDSPNFFLLSLNKKLRGKVLNLKTLPL